MKTTYENYRNEWKQLANEKGCKIYAPTSDSFTMSNGTTAMRISGATFRAHRSANGESVDMEITPEQFTELAKYVDKLATTITPKRAKNNRKGLAMLALFACSIFSSCKVGEFAMVATTPVNMTENYTLKKSHSIGRALSLNEAVDNCISNGNGAYITNVVIYEGLFRYKVVGDVYGK